MHWGRSPHRANGFFNEFIRRALASRLLFRAAMRYLRPLFLIAALLAASNADARRHRRAKPRHAAKMTQPKKTPTLSPLERAVLQKPIVAAVQQENDEETPGAPRKK